MNNRWPHFMPTKELCGTVSEQLSIWKQKCRGEKKLQMNSLAVFDILYLRQTLEGLTCPTKLHVSLFPTRIDKSISIFVARHGENSFDPSFRFCPFLHFRLLSYFFFIYLFWRMISLRWGIKHSSYLLCCLRQQKKFSVAIIPKIFCCDNDSARVIICAVFGYESL